jgi:hypothetical protein
MRKGAVNMTGTQKQTEKHKDTKVDNYAITVKHGMNNHNVKVEKKHRQTDEHTHRQTDKQKHIYSDEH